MTRMALHLHIQKVWLVRQGLLNSLQSEGMLAKAWKTVEPNVRDGALGGGATSALIIDAVIYTYRLTR